jgi:hypothetical protein
MRVFSGEVFEWRLYHQYLSQDSKSAFSLKHLKQSLKAIGFFIAERLLMDGCCRSKSHSSRPLNDRSCDQRQITPYIAWRVSYRLLRPVGAPLLPQATGSTSHNFGKFIAASRPLRAEQRHDSATPRV